VCGRSVPNGVGREGESGCKRRGLGRVAIGLGDLKRVSQGEGWFRQMSVGFRDCERGINSAGRQF